MAVDLEKDQKIQYVNGPQKIASTQDINFDTATSIFTKLKAYPYEFEIDSSLKLASINGISVKDTTGNDEDTEVSMTKEELRKIIKEEIASTMKATNFGNNYSKDEQVVGT